MDRKTGSKGCRGNLFLRLRDASSHNMLPFVVAFVFVCYMTHLMTKREDAKKVSDRAAMSEVERRAAALARCREVVAFQTETLRRDIVYHRPALFEFYLFADDARHVASLLEARGITYSMGTGIDEWSCEVLLTTYGTTESERNTERDAERAKRIKLIEASKSTLDDVFK